MDSSKRVSILFAGSVLEERELFIAMNEKLIKPYAIVCPEDLKAADAALETGSIDVIITDTSFGDGAFADWLVLWPRPFILLAYYGEEDRVDELIRDEACSYVMRDAGFRHIGGLPTMIRKVLNTRESLDRQNSHLQISERQYLDLLRSLPDIVYSLDSEGRFLYLNDSIRQLGYEPHELIGKHFSEILDPEDVPRVSRSMVLSVFPPGVPGPNPPPKLFDERRSGSRMTRNLMVRLRGASHEPGAPSARVDAYGEVSSVGLQLPEYEGLGVGTVGILRDVTVRAEAERHLKETLHTKELLVKEVHHRVKNNLQIISSLLNLQSDAIKDAEAARIFMNCQTQIHSMAMVHEQMDPSENFQVIDMGRYLSVLAEYLVRVLDDGTSAADYRVTCETIEIGADQAIPVGLIVNELVSLALSLPLSASQGRLVSIDFIRIGPTDLLLKVSTGLRAGTSMAASHPAGALSDQALGRQLVDALCAQLGGTVSWFQGDALCSIVFPETQRTGPVF